MIKLVVLLAALVSDRSTSQGEDRELGATAVEYGLMIALIAAVIVGAVFALGGSIEGIFNDTEDCITAQTAAACP